LADYQNMSDPQVAAALTKLDAIMFYLRSHIFERSDEIKTAVLALLSKQHVLYLGAPGTAKSMMIRDLCELIIGYRYFEKLMNPSTLPGELVGNVPLSNIKLGIEERNIQGMAPDCEIVFLDELFRGSGMILDIMLSMMNERIFHNANKIVRVPLVSMFSATNSIPDEPSIQAFYDRILFRHTVDDLKEDSSFVKMIQRVSAPRPDPITSEELTMLQVAASQVRIPDSVIDTLVKIRAAMRSAKIQVSPRRWNLGIDAVKSHALLRGSLTAGDQDLIVYKHILWSEPGNRQAVQKAVMEIANVHEAEAEDTFDAARTVYLETVEKDPVANSAVYYEARRKLQEASREISELSQNAKDQEMPTEHIDELWGHIVDYLQTLNRKQQMAKSAN
jgi:MoxR-like ATPase